MKMIYMNRVKDRKVKMEMCMEFFRKLGEALTESHEIIGSCNHDSSVYLIPKGKEDELSYYGKPVGSFRVSDHWNWFSSLKKCDKPAFELGFQCGRLSRTIARKIVTMSAEKKLKFENEFLKTQIRLAKAGKLDISKIESGLF